MSKQINDGGPAFPHPEIVHTLRDEKGYKTGDRVYAPQPGMTLRDYFAAHSIQAVWRDPDVKAMAAVKADSDDEAAQLMCKAAYAIADRMLKARED